MKLWSGPSRRHEERVPAECMSCGRGVRLDPSEPLALQPRCRCGSPLNWRVELGRGEPVQLICETFPQPFANRDRVKYGRPGRGARVGEALAQLRKGFRDGSSE